MKFIAGGIAVLLILMVIAAILLLIQHWHRFSPRRKRAIHIWAMMIGGGAYFLGTWGELVQGSASFSRAVICLCFVAMMVNFLRQRPTPQPWGQASSATIQQSFWEQASARYRVGAAAIIALGFSAGAGMLALALVGL
ncbi:MAG TPA: hypothetical protein VF201_08235 [Nitrolancea sp.]